MTPVLLGKRAHARCDRAATPKRREKASPLGNSLQCRIYASKSFIVKSFYRVLARNVQEYSLQSSIGKVSYLRFVLPLGTVAQDAAVERQRWKQHDSSTHECGIHGV